MLSVCPNQHTKPCKTFAKMKEQITFRFTWLSDKALRVSGNMAELPKNQKLSSEHLTDGGLKELSGEVKEK